MSAVDASGSDPRALEALLAFWTDSGVDVGLGETPIDRLAAPTPAAAIAQPPPFPEAEPARAAAPLGSDTRGPALAAAATDLTALEAAVAAFDGCALRAAGSGRAVFAHMPERADVVVIAEAPGADEEAAGAPFIGAAGALVRTLLRHAGLEQRALLTQTVFWRPPGGAAPSPADQAACLPFLERLIALARPKALLIMGEAASRGLLGPREPILKSRGVWAEWTGRHEALTLPAMPTLSPAFLLSRPALRKAAWGDILSLASQVDPPPP